MIDLEEALVAFVENAPEPPDVSRVTRRARQRRWHRRIAALSVVAVFVVAGIAGTIALSSTNHTGQVILQAPPTDSLRVTLLDGSQLEISGPPTLGLTKLDPAFSASLGTTDPPLYGYGHTLSVERTPPDGLGAVVGRYPTHDGHELVVYTTQYGVDAVVQYDSWVLVVTWAHDPTNWAVFASELNARETPDGFLVLEPVDPSWKLGLGDGPDAQLGGTGYGGDATYSFFGPRLYPNGCPTAAETTAHTPQGWGVFVGTDPAKSQAREWCDSDARVRIMVGDSQLGDAAVAGLRVAYTDPQHSVQRITTLGGSSFDITAPSSVFDQLTLQWDVYVDGLDTPNLLHLPPNFPNFLPVRVERASLPSTATAPSYATGDGHQLFSYVPPTDCGCEMLAGTYGSWLVEIEVQGMSVAQRTQIGSLFRANESADGFLTLDPLTPMHAIRGSGADIVLDGVTLVTSPSGCPPPLTTQAHTPEGFAVHFFSDGETWCDTNARIDVSVDRDPTRTLLTTIRVQHVDSVG